MGLVILIENVGNAVATESYPPPLPHVPSSPFLPPSPKASNGLAVKGRQGCGHSRERAETETRCWWGVCVGSARLQQPQKVQQVEAKLDRCPLWLDSGPQSGQGTWREQRKPVQGGDADGAASSGAQLGLPVPLPLGL